MNANSGYSGWSMSNRAVEAYESGEKPKSKWTKKAMLAEIASYIYGEDVSDEAVAYLEGLAKDELFRRFFYNSSWHHTSKCFNITNFYALDESELDSFIQSPTAWEYRIEYSTEETHVKDGRAYATQAKAIRALSDKGFRPCGVVDIVYWKGKQCAEILVEERPIAKRA